MKVTADFKKLLRKIARNVKTTRELYQQLFAELDKMGVNTDTRDFENALGYLSGDGCAYPLVDYIEGEVENERKDSD